MVDEKSSISLIEVKGESLAASRVWKQEGVPHKRQKAGSRFGTGPLSADGHRVVAGSIREEAQQALANLRAIVEGAEGTTKDIVQCTIYISNIADWSEVNDIYGTFFAGVAVLPARAVVPVKQMHYGAHIEIQAIAFLKQI